MIEFSVSIPLIPVLIAFVMGGALAGLVVSFFGWREFFSLNMARHNYMAHMLHELKRRNNDWEKVPPPELWGKRRADRLARYVLDKIYNKDR